MSYGDISPGDASGVNVALDGAIGEDSALAGLVAQLKRLSVVLPASLAASSSKITSPSPSSTTAAMAKSSYPSMKPPRAASRHAERTRHTFGAERTP
eukprot:6211442-Pleurochrysis_carterae.AAC.2